MTLVPLTSAEGAPFQELFAIYAASITPREQKPEDWLRAMVVALPDFGDDPDASNESKLESIQMAWLEEYKDLHK